MRLILLFVLLPFSLLLGCASQQPAPVSDRSGAVPVVEVPPGHYAVKKGDTLYRIALDHGVDYKDVITWNRIENANRIETGQVLRVTPPEGAAVAKPVTGMAPVEVRPVAAPSSSPPSSPVPTPVAGGNSATYKREPKGGKLPYSEEALARLREAEGGPVTTVAAAPVETTKPAEKPTEKPAAPVPAPAADSVDWAWPAPGKVLAGYSDSGGPTNKGIDIGGKAGEPVHAAAKGVVRYVGEGLRGFGKLVVVHHNPTYLSVYAHNSKILVKEGQPVTKGQKIAEIGSSDTDQTKLHFEIRRLGKPVDPAQYLPPR